MNWESAYDVPGVHADGAYVSLLAPGKTDYTDCHPRLPRILHVVPITAHTHDRRKSTGKKGTKKRKDEGKKRQKSEKTRKERKGKRRQENKKKQDKKRKQGKEKCHTSRRQELTKDGIGLIEGINCIITGTG